jgi:hypothetical protein
MDEVEKMRENEEMKDQVYFADRAAGLEGAGDEKVYDIESQRMRNERRQAILRQTIAEETGD